MPGDFPVSTSRPDPGGRTRRTRRPAVPSGPAALQTPSPQDPGSARLHLPARTRARSRWLSRSPPVTRPAARQSRPVPPVVCDMRVHQPADLSLRDCLKRLGQGRPFVDNEREVVDVMGGVVGLTAAGHVHRRVHGDLPLIRPEHLQPELKLVTPSACTTASTMTTTTPPDCGPGNAACPGAHSHCVASCSTRAASTAPATTRMASKSANANCGKSACCREGAAGGSRTAPVGRVAWSGAGRAVAREGTGDAPKVHALTPAGARPARVHRQGGAGAPSRSSGRHWLNKWRSVRRG